MGLESVDTPNKEKALEDYEALSEVLNLAYERCAHGKGRVRHGDNKSFTQQEICTELRIFGLTPAIVQIRKKAKECLRLPPEAGLNELLDVIVYACGAYIVLKEEETHANKM